MNQTLDEALCAKYPLIFKDRFGDMRRTLMCWGFECGDGWYDLLDSTCALIYWPYAQTLDTYTYLREQEGAVPYEGEEAVTAVDVERARLAMSAAAEALPVAVQIKEKYGTLRFYVNGGDEQAHAYIEFAEHHSSKICDVCGAPGKLSDGGWLRTRCAEHA